ncbi:MAG: hypothetical protein A3F14_01500 [Gammaproteobacteria bacterium RIFCSPHIGHO2_12_FULL_43_28]|nr:MAG: hypothetical protein A3F14_01500 [Gammaproteobacteria bacterium RIFCSPHIGHO2_12_FULL_43_28]
MKNTLTFQPPVIAHRGASAYAPENTMSAFTKAVQLGIKWIEFDVMLAACGEMIIFHDETLDRTTDGKGEVYRFPYSYLHTLDAGKWFAPTFSGEKIPTFSEVMTFLEETSIYANVEIKPAPGQDKELVLRLVEEIETHFKHLKSKLLFSSFSAKSLRYLRKRMPEANIGLLLHHWKRHWAATSDKLKCIAIHVNHEILTPDAARNIKDMGQSLLCYTVNNPARAAELFSWGVDAVFSDAPDKILI